MGREVYRAVVAEKPGLMPFPHPEANGPASGNFVDVREEATHFHSGWQAYPAEVERALELTVDNDALARIVWETLDTVGPHQDFQPRRLQVISAVEDFAVQGDRGQFGG